MPMTQLEALVFCVMSMENIAKYTGKPGTDMHKEATAILHALALETQQFDNNQIKRRDAAWDVLMELAGEPDVHLKVTAYSQDRNGAAGWIETLSVWRPEKP